MKFDHNRTSEVTLPFKKTLRFRSQSEHVNSIQYFKLLFLVWKLPRETNASTPQGA